jgi:hypothetical protein
MLLGVSNLVAQQTQGYPLVLRADAPIYPPLARMARITGKIAAKFTVVRGEVASTEIGLGHPLLVKATNENIKSWHFSPEVTGIFMTTFDYRLEGRETATMQNPRTVMWLPESVRIVAAPTSPPGEAGRR